VVLSEEEIRSINENVVYGRRFLKAFGVESGEKWTLTYRSCLPRTGHSGNSCRATN
jgi:hypothetical protein